MKQDTNISQGQIKIFGMFSMKLPLGRFILEVAMSICLLLSPHALPATTWTGNFWPKSVLLKIAKKKAFLLFLKIWIIFVV